MEIDVCKAVVYDIAFERAWDSRLWACRKVCKRYSLSDNAACHIRATWALGTNQVPRLCAQPRSCRA